MQNDYYEGILQIRPSNKTVIAYVKRHVSKRNDVFIAKEIIHKTGVDLYLSSRTFLVSLARRLKKSFGGTVKVSRTLHSVDRMTSKKRYRVTVCFRL